MSHLPRGLALGVAALAGLTLVAGAAASPASALDAAPKLRAPVQKTIKLVHENSLNDHTIVTDRSYNGPFTSRVFNSAETSVGLADRITVKPVGENAFTMQSRSSTACFVPLVASGYAFLSFGSCTDATARWTQTDDGLFVNSAGWWITADVISPVTGGSANFGVLALSQSVDDAGDFAYSDVRADGALSAVVVFDEDVAVEAKLIGRGSPFEEVRLVNSASDVVAKARTAADGSFEVNIPAPDRGQPYVLDMVQTLGLDGTLSDPVRLYVDYGAAVTVTSPLDGSAHPGGRLDVSGQGEPGGRVTIREAGKPAVIATADVLATGVWTARGVSLDGAEHKLEVKQLSKGNNTTTSTITLNPGGTVTPPAPGIAFEVTTPKNDSTIETSDKQVTFTGRGNPGSKVSIMNGARTIGSVASVPASGNWSFTATMNYADYNLTAYYKKVPTGAVTSQQPLHITVAPGQVGFAVGSPAAGTTVDRGTFAFTGTGKAGSTVTVFLGSSKRGTATTAADGTWTVPVTVNTPGRYDFTVYYKANPADAAAPSVKHALTVR